MIDLKNIIKSAEIANKEFHDGYPPVEKWNPDHCGEIGLEIKRDGTWFYMGSPIGRKRLVNLFARILRKEKDGSYVLVTPVEKIIIKVEDDGPGIAESEYDNVFKPFYKIDKGRADSKSSVGLGLSIASDIVRSHGGNIKLNKSKLHGLEVKIFLPV